MRSDSDILAAVARALNGSVSVDDALDGVLETVTEHLNLSAGWVWVAQPDGGFRIGASRRLPEGLRRNPEWTSGSCTCQARFCDGELAGGDVEQLTCSRLDALVTGTDGLRHHASLALEADGERLGIMNLASRDWRELTDAQLQLLRAVSDMLAVALVRARLYERSAEIGALEERARLSREMHDGVAQTLSALVLRLEALNAVSEQHNGELEHALALARSGLSDTRQAVVDLRVSPFGERLVDAVDAVLRTARNRTALKVDLHSEIDGEPPTRLIHAACRILQEGLTNVARHAGVEACRVEVAAHNDSLTLAIHDQGLGFAVDPADGFGIIGMRERAHLVGAQLEITSSSAGTSLRFHWSAS